MRWGRLQPGDYAGHLQYTIAGHWVVSIWRYLGSCSDFGYDWQPVSGRGFLSLDALARQLKAASLPINAKLEGGHYLLVPTSRKGRYGPEGGRIRRFMNTHYGIYGPDGHPVSWRWHIRQYG